MLPHLHVRPANARARVFLRELNIEYEDKYYEYDDTWPGVNKSLGVSITGTLPVLKIDGKRLYQVRAQLCCDCRRRDASLHDGPALLIKGSQF
jgi:glutathione S-transferase